MIRHLKVPSPRPHVIQKLICMRHSATIFTKAVASYGSFIISVHYSCGCPRHLHTHVTRSPNLSTHPSHHCGIHPSHDHARSSKCGNRPMDVNEARGLIKSDDGYMGTIQGKVAFKRSSKVCR